MELGAINKYFLWRLVSTKRTAVNKHRYEFFWIDVFVFSITFPTKKKFAAEVPITVYGCQYPKQQSMTESITFSFGNFATAWQKLYEIHN